MRREEEVILETQRSVRIVTDGQSFESSATSTVQNIFVSNCADEDLAHTADRLV